MTLVVRARVEAQEPGLVGRESERAVAAPRPRTATVPRSCSSTASAGSASPPCSRRSRAEARAQGAVVVSLDGGAVEPTPRGFLAALSSATGGELDDRGRRRRPARPARGSRRPDARPLRGPPADRPVAPAGRSCRPCRRTCGWSSRAGSHRWPGWPIGLGRLFRSLPLGNLPRADAEALLRRDGVTGEDIERINWLARGHPLSLRMAAAALVTQPARDHDTTTVTAIVDELTELYLAGLDPATREALDAASVVRRPTISLLSAMLPDAAPQDAFDRLRGLPFVELTSDGLVAARHGPRRASPRTCGPPTLTGCGATGSPRGASCATRSGGPHRRRCGATPPTCCSSSRTR